jgi:hypothetical protein
LVVGYWKPTTDHQPPTAECIQSIVMRNFTRAIGAVLLLITPQTLSSAQARIEASRLSGSDGAASIRYRYVFENPRFTTPLQEVVFDGNGQGQFRFKRKDSEEIVNQLAVSARVLAQIQAILNELNFLSSREDYQHKKDFSHLGTMTITYARGGKERTVSFNYTDNQSLTRLSDIFRNLVTQETRIFELETVVANDPISTPAQLRLLESELKSKRIADPQRFEPMLRNLKLDESVPLIARNHAERLLQTIRNQRRER